MEHLLWIFKDFEEHLNTGDPTVREWFLIKTNFWPIFLCCMYLLIIKVIGPAYMRNKRPYELRTTMMVYNLFIVLIYAIGVSIALNCVRHLPTSVMCKNSKAEYGTYNYTLASCGWMAYILKYVEFLDTIFFVLRKKEKLITNLHVIHHFIIPLFGWFMLRTEKSGFQAIPIMINAMVHIVMYSYYALAAMGPNVRKYLWWKRYLTILQMSQFILIFSHIAVVGPITGCTTSKTSRYLNLIGTVTFFAMFYNFYQNTFKPQKIQNEEIVFKNSNSNKNGYQKAEQQEGIQSHDDGSKVKFN